MTNNIKPFPVSMEAPDDRLLITMSDGSIVDKGRLSGYPGTQMSELGVDSLGTAYWVDPLGTRTNISKLVNRLSVDYVGNVPGLVEGVGELSPTLLEIVRKYNVPSPIIDTIFALPYGSNSFPDPVEVSPLVYRWDGLATVSINSRLTNSGYSPLQAMSTTPVLNSSDGFLWDRTLEDKYLTIEFDTVLPLHGLIYQSLRSDYPVKNGVVEHSIDGVTWSRIVNIEATDKKLDLVFETPINCKFIRLMESAASAAGVGRFTPILSVTNTNITLSVNDEWYDRRTVKVDETDDGFTLDNLFNFVPNAETFTPVVESNKTILQRTISSGTIVNRQHSQIDLIKFTDVVHNGLGTEVEGKSVLFTPGTYRVKYNVNLLGVHSTSGLLRHSVSLYRSRDMLSIAVPHVHTLYMEKNQSVEVSGIFEFYIDKNTYLTLGIGSSVTVSLVLEYDIVDSLSIQKVSDGAPMSNSYQTLSEKYKSIFDKYDNKTLKGILSLTGKFEPGLTPSSLLIDDDSYMSLIVDPEMTERYIEFNLPEAEDIIAWSMDNVALSSSVMAPLNFKIQAYNDSYWKDMSVVTNNVNTGGYTTYGAYIEPDRKYSQWRILFIDDASVIRLKNFRLHTSESKLLSRISADVTGPDVVYGTTGEYMTSTNVRSITSLKYPIVIRADEQFNLLASKRADTVTANMSGTIRNLETQELTYFDLGLVTDCSHQLLLTNLPPGMYQIDSVSVSALNINNLYLERSI